MKRYEMQGFDCLPWPTKDGEWCKVEDIINELERRIYTHSPFVTPVEREGFKEFLDWVRKFEQ
jgi:hypothetical protein